jgi:predicted NACHT family NTPase
VQVIVTCRTQSQESRFERFQFVEVADFKEPQVRSFSEHWFKTVMRDESAGLARAGKFLEQLFWSRISRFGVSNYADFAEFNLFGI